MNTWTRCLEEANEAALPEGGGMQDAPPVDPAAEGVINLEEDNAIDLAGEPQTDAPPPEGDYHIEYPETFSGDDGLKALIAEHGQKAGIPAEAMGSFVASMDEALRRSQAQQEAQERTAAQQDVAALKTEWGAEYNQRLAACRRTASLIAGALGCTVQDVAAMGFNSAIGTRFLYGISKLFGEGGLKGRPADTHAGGREEARRLASDPAHPLYKAFHDPADPRHAEADAAFNKYFGVQ